MSVGKVLWKGPLFKQSSKIYPNTSIVLRVLLTILVTVAGAETRFSNLKVIKNVLLSTVSNKRLSALGIISLGYEFAKSLDFDVLIDKFAKKKGNFFFKVYAITN